MFGRNKAPETAAATANDATTRTPPTPVPPPASNPEQTKQTGTVTRVKVQYSGSSIHTRIYFAVVTANPDKASADENTPQSEHEAPPEIVLFGDVHSSQDNGMALIECGDRLLLMLVKQTGGWKISSAELIKSVDDEKARLRSPKTESGGALAPRHPLRAPR